MPHYRRFVVDALGLRVAVHEWAPGAAEPEEAVLFWHGFGPYSGYHALEFATVLADAHATRVLAVDAPGFGRSPAAPRSAYRLSNLARLAGEVLTACDARGAFFVGHSWGASVGCRVAADFPESLSGLVLLDGGHVEPPRASFERHREEAAAIRERYRFETDEAHLAEERRLARRWTPEYEEACRAAWTDDGRGIVMIVTPEVAASVREGASEVPLASLYPKIAASGLAVLLLVPAEGSPAEVADRARAVERFRAAIPTAEAIELAGTSHFIVDDLGPALAEPLARWIGTNARSSTAAEATRA